GRNKNVCIAAFVLTHVRIYPCNERLRLKGLDNDAHYKDMLSGAEFSGSELMNFGLPVHLTLEYKSVLWILEKI
ncbi:MAG: GH36 C-terminal domain-containing protein, partial [Clostridia bacterium]